MSRVKTVVRRLLGRARPADGTDAGAPVPVRRLVERTFENVSPLPARVEPRAPRHVTVVTDGAGPAQLFGGVGTSLILGALAARRQGLALRVVARTVPISPEAVAAFLATFRIALPAPAETLFAPEPTAQPFGVADDETVITTSWWTTRAALGSLPVGRIVYLLQEDERMFYAGGDQHLLCSETLARTDVRYVVNTQGLLDHFVAEGVAGPAACGVAFEPAFPEHLYHREPRAGRKRFLFYARPGHPRNLFVRGAAALDEAFRQGLLPPEEWDVHLVGSDIPNVDFGDRQVFVHDSRPWEEYAQLVRGVDLGLSLMYTPHPSYPPLDIAASGGVVVTNAFGLKRDLSHLSANIITVPLDVERLVAGIAAGTVLAGDVDARARNVAGTTLSRSWERSLGHVLRDL